MLSALLALVLELPPAARAALSEWDAGHRVEAADRMAELAAEHPDDLELRRELVRMEIAIHRYRSAWDHLAGLGSELDPTRGKVLYLLGRYEEALAFLDADDPDHTLARHDALVALGRAEEARAALDRAAAVLGEEHARIQTLRGVDLAARGDHAGAVARFRAALRIDPLEQEARFALGRSLLALGERDEGVAVLEQHRRLVPLIDRLQFARKSLDLAPRHAPNLAELGDCERLLGRTDEAQRAYEQAFALAQGDEVVPVALRFARLWLEDRGDLERALLVLDDALARVRDPRLLVRAGDYLAEHGRHADAALRFERALELAPGAAPIETRLAEARARAGRGG